MIVNWIGRATGVERGKVHADVPSDWTIVEIEPDTAENLDERGPPAVLMIEGSLGDEKIRAIVDAVRAGPRRLATVPILLVGDNVPGAPPRGVDACIVRSGDSQDWASTISAWGSSVPVHGLRRLAATFGTAALTPLVEGFRAQLDEAIGRIDDDDLKARAHRLAGIAGTLGFADVSRAWIRLSRGDERAKHDAIRTARIALAAIDRTAEIANE